MSTSILLLGESGSGKSTSLRNMQPENTLVIQCISKPLPFKSKNWQPCTKENPQGSLYQSAKTENILKAMQRTAKDIIVIDDYQACLVGEMMERSTERGYDKFTDIAKGAWQIFGTAGQLAAHKRIYILAHTHTGEDGKTRMKTVGKMVDEKIVPEGYFTIVLKTETINGNYLFATQTNGSDCCKSPLGMFEAMHIDNDLAIVDTTICDYYGISTAAPQPFITQE